MTTATKTTLAKLMDLIKSAGKSKQEYRVKIQTALEMFIKEYNGALTYNRTPFKAICEAVGNDVVALRAYLFTYTNMTKVKADYSFETDEAQKKADSDGNEYFVYNLKFKQEYAGQKWWECAPEKTIETLTDDNFLKSVKALINKYTREAKPANLNDSNKAILSYLKSKIA